MSICRCTPAGSERCCSAALAPTMLFTKDTLHTQLTTAQLKSEQPSNGGGMEIGEREKTNQRQPINFHLLHCFLVQLGKGNLSKRVQKRCGSLHSVLSSLHKRLENANDR